MNSDSSKIKEIIGQFDKPLQDHVIKNLITPDKEFVKKYCLEGLSNGDKNRRDELLKILKDTDSSCAFSHIISWILEFKEFPEYSWYKVDDLNDDHLIGLIEIFENSLVHNYGNDVFFNRNTYLDGIIDLGSRNDSNYKTVEGKLLFWIGKFKDLKYLYYQIEKLEQSYYLKRSRAITFEEAIQLLDNGGHFRINRIEKIWNSNKVLIEIILALLGIIGFIIAFL